MEDCIKCSGETSDPDLCLREISDVQDCSIPGNIPKLQFRERISVACWNDVTGMAEVVDKKGGIWTTTGIVCGNKIYCSAEETLFLLERGELCLSGNGDSSVQLKDMYKRVAEGKYGCCSECFEVYRHLKSFGYIVGRYGIPWIADSTKDKPASPESVPEMRMITAAKIENLFSMGEMLNSLKIDGLGPQFDVFLPNSKFRKSSPGNPSFALCLTRGLPPSTRELKDLEAQCKGIPLKFCHVEYGRVSFFSFDRVDLPVLP